MKFILNIERRIIIFIVIILFFIGNINSQTTYNLGVYGPVYFNTQYEAVNNITSGQVIHSGKTTYMAGNEIILEPGFEVKLGAEFEATHAIVRNLLTYNIWSPGTASDKFTKHAQVIINSNADVVSIQEIKGVSNFHTLTEKSIMNGMMVFTNNVILDNNKSGIAVMYSPVLDKPTLTYKLMNTPNDGSETKRAYIVAEFIDFVFVATHFSLNKNHRNEMANDIINNVLKKTNKPVYIAGDMNEYPLWDWDSSILRLYNNGFDILNDTLIKTKPPKVLDLVLEYNKNSTRKLLAGGIPSFVLQQTGWLGVISDHFPYFVTVKVRNK